MSRAKAQPADKSRDPRVDPVIGDVVLGRRQERTVYCLYEDGGVGWATESPLASGACSLQHWRDWARDGEIGRIPYV
jgi:hypothetical protein